MIYFIQGERTKLVKIGRSAHLTKRLMTLQTGSAEWLTCLAVIENVDSEAWYHERFEAARVHGEWFEPTEQLMTFIESLPETKYTGVTVRSKEDGKVPQPAKPQLGELIWKSVGSSGARHSLGPHPGGPAVRPKIPQSEYLIVPPFREGSHVFLDFLPSNRVLTPKQKVCVLTYIETRDPDAAIMAAYDCKDVATAERLKYDIFSRPQILEALSIYLGSDDPEVQKFIQRAAKNERISEVQVHELEATPTVAAA